MKHWRRVLVLAALATTACGDGSLPPLELDIKLSASRGTAMTGDTISFVAEAQGTNLVGVIIAYGDQGSDQFATFGARTARVTFRHAYSIAAVYTVTANVTDSDGRQKEASQQVTITPR
jgi:hypothetical protein